MARVLVEGTEYTITPDKTHELLQWLNTNGAIRVEGNTEQKFEGKELLNEEKLIKLSYFHTTEEIRDLLIFFIFVEKKIDISMIEKKIEFLENVQKPIFPIEADFLKSEFGFSQGRELGDALKKLEKHWIDNNFNIEKKQIKNILNL